MRTQTPAAARRAPPPDVLTTLREVLGDPDPEVRFWVIRALGSLGTEDDLPTLERIAATDDVVAPHWWSIHDQAEAAIAMIRMRSSSMSHELVRDLRKRAKKTPGAQSERFGQAAEDLERAEAAFLDQALALLADRTVGVRADERLASAICSAVAVLSDPRAIPVMRDLLYDRTLDESIRAEAAYTLGRMRVKAATPYLIRVARDEADENWVRIRAIEGLAWLGSARGNQALLAFANDGSRPSRLRGVAITGLAQRFGRAPEPAVLPLAREFCLSEDVDVATGALFALSNVGTAEDLPMLESLVARDPVQPPEPGSVASAAGDAIHGIERRIAWTNETSSSPTTT